MRGLRTALCLVVCAAFVLCLSAWRITQADAGNSTMEYDEATQQLAVEGHTGTDAPSYQDLSTLSGMMAAGKVSSILVLGDSISVGYHLEGFDAPSDTGVLVFAGRKQDYYETPTYVANWTNAFRSYAYEHGVKSFVNASVIGFRMQFLAKKAAELVGDGADVIVVMLGTNDAAHVPIDDFRAYAEKALAACENGCQHLVVVSPPKNQRTNAYNLYGMDQVDRVLTDLCEEHGWEHISLLDALEVGSSDCYSDQLHPTEAGSAKLWESFSQQLGLVYETPSDLLSAFGNGGYQQQAIQELLDPE